MPWLNKPSVRGDDKEIRLYAKSVGVGFTSKELDALAKWWKKNRKNYPSESGTGTHIILEATPTGIGDTKIVYNFERDLEGCRDENKPLIDITDYDGW